MGKDGLLWNCTTKVKQFPLRICRGIPSTKIFQAVVNTCQDRLHTLLIVISYAPRCISMSKWYSATLLQMGSATSDKSDFKHLSYAWRMSEWRNPLPDLLKLEHCLTHLPNFMMTLLTFWNIFRSAYSINCTLVRSQTMAWSISLSALSRNCIVDKSCSLSAQASESPSKTCKDALHDIATVLASRKGETTYSGPCTNCCALASRSSVLRGLLAYS